MAAWQGQPFDLIQVFEVRRPPVTGGAAPLSLAGQA
jgi:hypothetical protein